MTLEKNVSNRQRKHHVGQPRSETTRKCTREAIHDRLLGANCLGQSRMLTASTAWAFRSVELLDIGLLFFHFVVLLNLNFLFNIISTFLVWFAPRNTYLCMERI
jgi:hypothetical protein